MGTKILFHVIDKMGKGKSIVGLESEFDEDHEFTSEIWIEGKRLHCGTEFSIAVDEVRSLGIEFINV